MNTRLSALTKHPRGSTAAALGQAQTDHVSFIGSGMCLNGSTHMHIIQGNLQYT